MEYRRYIGMDKAAGNDYSAYIIYTEKGLDIKPIRRCAPHSWVWPKWYQTSTTLYVAIVVLIGAIVTLGIFLR